MIHVQFTDASESMVCSVFTSAQQDQEYQNQGEIELSDERYKSFYDALPEQIKKSLQAPVA